MYEYGVAADASSTLTLEAGAGLVAVRQLQHEERPANLDLIAVVQRSLARRQSIDEAGICRIEIANRDLVGGAGDHAVTRRYG
jgi:hypothetical protein